MILGANLGIGVDIENIDRFLGLKIPENNAFLNKIYTKRELEYCFSKNNSAQHLAVRFAGKEAVIKALSSLEYEFSDFTKIEISNNEKGVPSVRINLAGFEDFNIKLSLSHCEDKALAFAVIKK